MALSPGLSAHRLLPGWVLITRGAGDVNPVPRPHLATSPQTTPGPAFSGWVFREVVPVFLFVCLLLLWVFFVLFCFFCFFFFVFRASLIAQFVKNPPAMQETPVLFLGQEGPLEKEKSTHCSILAWRIS